MYVKYDIHGRVQKKSLRRHRLRHVVVILGETPPSALEQLPIEADKTRWWLQDQNCWRSSSLLIEVSLESEDEETLVLYPILDDPNRPAGMQQATAFLAFDATVFINTEIGLVSIDVTDPDMENAAEYLVDKLRLIRGE